MNIISLAITATLLATNSVGDLSAGTLVSSVVSSSSDSPSPVLIRSDSCFYSANVSVNDKRQAVLKPETRICQDEVKALQVSGPAIIIGENGHQYTFHSGTAVDISSWKIITTE